MKKIIAAALLVMLVMTGTLAEAERHRILPENKRHFAKLLTALVNAYEQPSAGDDTEIDAELEAIAQASEADYEIASAIADHWRAVYLDDEYRLYIHHEGELYASELEKTCLRDSSLHAFVVLGYELKNGEMSAELVGRCEAAAAAARSYPNAIIVCSGGATGENNPRMHTEADMMRDYLVDKCGIDPSRIHIDTNAMTTIENAVNTLRILEREGMETMTIVTSTYHQRWGQAIYNAVAVMYWQAYGYDVEIEENYCYETEPPKDAYRNDDRIAAHQIAQLLDVPMNGAR